MYTPSHRTNQHATAGLSRSAQDSRLYTQRSKETTVACWRHGRSSPSCWASRHPRSRITSQSHPRSTSVAHSSSVRGKAPLIPSFVCLRHLEPVLSNHRIHAMLSLEPTVFLQLRLTVPFTDAGERIDLHCRHRLILPRSISDRAVPSFLGWWVFQESAVC